MALTPVPPGELATVVTYLEMTAPPAPGPLPASFLRLEHRPRPDLACYRALFRRVGARWLWFSRLVMTDDELAEILHDPAVEMHAIVAGEAADEEDVGWVEFDFRAPGRCALAYVGLVPALAGRGHGRWLLARALASAWRPGVETVSVHTCTLDHPAALPAYRRAGFAVTRRAIESFPDPRLHGWLDPGDAPQVARL